MRCFGGSCQRDFRKPQLAVELGTRSTGLSSLSQPSARRTSRSQNAQTPEAAMPRIANAIRGSCQRTRRMHGTLSRIFDRQILLGQRIDGIRSQSVLFVRTNLTVNP
jgi:hypothetical protein